MSTPVYQQFPTVKNRPCGRLDAQGRPIPSSFGNMAFQGDYAMTSNLTYVGFARPGSATSAPVWQIFLLSYSGSDLTSITWPQDPNGAASNDYEFIWDDRAGYTYS